MRAAVCDKRTVRRFIVALEVMQTLLMAETQNLHAPTTHEGGESGADPWFVCSRAAPQENY